MKLFIFLFGLTLGAIGHHFYVQSLTPAPEPLVEKPAPAPTTPEASAPRTLSERATETAQAARQAVAQKMADWHLTPAEINRELEKTGRVVRSKTAEVSQSLANARLAATVKGKYALDSDLSARAIQVEVSSGKVILRGTVASPEFIARAITLALDTEGVTEVDSQLTVKK